MKEITYGEYRITYDSETAVVTFQGKMRVPDYESRRSIVKLLNDALAENPPAIKLDIEKLEFINSSGIDVLYSFAHKVYRSHHQLIVRRLATGAPWQERLVRTIEVMAPNLKLELVKEAASE